MSLIGYEVVSTFPFALRAYVGRSCALPIESQWEIGRGSFPEGNLREHVKELSRPEGCEGADCPLKCPIGSEGASQLSSRLRPDV